VSDPKFKKPENVQLKTPASELFEDEPAKTEWLDLPPVQKNVYPYNGAAVLVTPDGDQSWLAVWRDSRAYNKVSARFEDVSFWAVRNSGCQRIPFEPLGYKPFEEPVYVPKKKVTA
jgi:hypothetical protein